MRRPSVIFLLSLIGGMLFYWNGLIGVINLLPLLILSLMFDYKNSKLFLCVIGVILGFALCVNRGGALETQAQNALSVYSESHNDSHSESTSQVSLTGIFYQRDFLDEKSCWLKLPSQVYVRLQLSPFKTYDKMNSGSVVCVNGNFKIPENPRNPNGFDEKKWLFSKHAIGTIQVEEILLKSQIGDSVEQFRYRIGKPLVEGLLQNTAFQQGPLAAGMLLGEDAWIPEDVLKGYMASGTNHILSISGAHFGVLLLCIYQLIGKLDIPYYRKKIGIWVVLGLFIWLIGMDSAAVRAYLMFLFFDTAKWGYKQADALNSLCLTAVTMFLINPFILWDIGLQLALAAMYGLLVLAPFVASCFFMRKSDVSQKKKSLLERLLNPVLVSGCACLCLYPILRSQFNTFSWWSLIYNIPVSILSAAYLPLGALEGFATPFQFLARSLGILTGSILYAMTWITNTSLYLPRREFYASLSTLQLNLFLWLLLLPLYFKQISTGINIAYCKRFQKIEKPILLLFMTTAILITVNILPTKGLSKDLRVFYFDVGQGDGSAIITPKGQVLVIDTGLEKGQKQVADSLLKIGIDQIDYLILSHPHADHIAGAGKIIEKLKVKKLVYFDGNYNDSETKALNLLASQVKQKGGTTENWSRGDQFELEPEVVIDVLHPQKSFDSESANDESLVVDLSFRETNFLFTGDISTKVEYDIMKQAKSRATVLKVPHHGSSTSSGETLLSLPNIALTVVQVGAKNLYGHPKREVLERYEKKQIPLLRNDQSGCVSVISDGKSIRYRVQIMR